MKITFKNFIFLAFGVSITLGAIYSISSYTQVLKNKRESERVVFEQLESDLNQSFEQITKYTDLIAYRLQNIGGFSEKQLSHILSLRVDPILNKVFPEIIKLEFIPGNSNVFYSRFGKSTRKDNLQYKLSKKKPGWGYSGNGVFSIAKPIFNVDKSKLGDLYLRISTQFILDKIHPDFFYTVHEGGSQHKNIDGYEAPIGKTHHYIRMETEPYSFIDYMNEYRFTIFYVGLLILISVCIGKIVGSSLKAAQLKKQILKIRGLEDDGKELSQQNVSLNSEVDRLRSIVRTKDKATRKKLLLYNTIYDRYKEMAAQALAMTSVANKLSSANSHLDKTWQEIEDISHATELTLQSMLKGFIAASTNDDIDALNSLEQCKEYFLSDIIEKNLTLDIEAEGDEDFAIQFDKDVLHLILFNIFNICINRLMDNGSLRIKVRKQDHLEICFIDNGYDIEDKLKEIKSAPQLTESIILNKAALRDFVTTLGWKLYFHHTDDGFNIIELHLLKNGVSLPTNVVRLFNS